MTGPEADARAREDLRAVRAVLEGETDAFRELVERYQGMVAGIAWRAGVGREDVEDVTSEVFVKAYGNLAQFRPDHPFATWLYRLAMNHSIDHTRKGRRERLRSEMPAQVADEGPGAAADLERDERQELVRRALDAIDPRYGNALRLVYVEGRKVEEAAAILEVPEGTIKTRLMRGREALRRMLERRHPEHFGGEA